MDSEGVTKAMKNKTQLCVDYELTNRSLHSHVSTSKPGSQILFPFPTTAENRNRALGHIHLFKLVS